MTPSQEARIAAIFDAAAELFGERTPEDVTMEEIAARAGVAKGTLYNYFASKEELFRELLGSRFDELTEALEDEPDLRSRIARLFRFQVCRAHWFRMRRQAEGIAGVRALLREKEERVECALRSALESDGQGPHDSKRDARLIVGSVEAAVTRCLQNGRDGIDLDEELDELWRFVRRAVGRGRARTPRLDGRTVAVTREEPANGPLSRALLELGARVLNAPLLETHPPENPAELQAEAQRLGEYDWILFTSARAVRAFSDVAPSNGSPPLLAVVGEATAKSARHRGWEPTLVGKAGAASLVEDLRRAHPRLSGASILFPAAERVHSAGLEELRRLGAEVRVVTAYRTRPCARGAAELSRALTEESIDAITFASPSAVEAFVNADRPAAGRSAPRLAALGPSTAAALVAHGLPVSVVAPRPDFEELAHALAEQFEKES